jgi:hypothetical protein
MHPHAIMKAHRNIHTGTWGCACARTYVQTHRLWCTYSSPRVPPPPPQSSPPPEPKASYLCECVCMRTCMHTCMNLYECMCVCMYVRHCTYMNASACVYVCMYSRMPARNHRCDYRFKKTRRQVSVVPVVDTWPSLCIHAHTCTNSSTTAAFLRCAN